MLENMLSYIRKKPFEMFITETEPYKDFIIKIEIEGFIIKTLFLISFFLWIALAIDLILNPDEVVNLPPQPLILWMGR